MQVLQVNFEGEFIGYVQTNKEANDLIKQRAERVRSLYVGDCDFSHSAVEEYFEHLLKCGSIYVVDIDQETWNAYQNGEL